MFMCCTKWYFVINSIYSEQVFSYIMLPQSFFHVQNILFSLKPTFMLYTVFAGVIPFLCCPP